MHTSITRIPQAVWVPYWLRPVMALSHISSEDLLDLSIMEKKLSHEDFQSFKAVNVFMANAVPSLHGLASVDPMYVRDAIERLTLQSTDLGLETTYRVDSHDTQVFLISVDLGFINTIRIREQQLRFVSECLKVHYSFVPIHQASRSTLFLKYLDLLNSKVPFL